jgi:hypothetical protein
MVNPSNSKEEVTRLTVYAEKLKQQIAACQNPSKKEFFERDLKKTLSKIDKIK